MFAIHGVLILVFFDFCVASNFGPGSEYGDIVLNEGQHEISGNVTVRSLIVHAGANITFKGNHARLTVRGKSLKLHGEANKPIHLFSKDFLQPDKRQYSWKLVDHGYQSKHL